MKKYTYTGIAQSGVAFVQGGGVAAVMISTVIAGGIMVMAIVERIPSSDPSFMGSLGCLAVWFLMVGWLVGLSLMNIYPTVWVGDEHLVISAFFVARVAVPWTEIIDVGAGHVPFGHTLVRAHRITPAHRLYGWLYSRTLYPSFVIGRWIQDRDELLREIRWRAQQAQISGPPSHGSERGENSL
jgi:hypothetical protein